jgi:subtilisin family serine protease
MKRALLVAGLAALALAASAAAFTPPNPFYDQQWYLAQDHAFDAWPAAPTNLAPVKIADLDSGLDCSLPDFAGRVVAARSFVGGDPCNDADGHGTIVAGEMVADLGSNGIVGMAYSAQLIVAKVVRSDGSIPLQAEADAIHWAVDQGARVINLSFGGVRDPAQPSRDTFSQVEADAISYAWSKGAVIVAAVGNADEANATTWPYASYPAALPHVLGVSALTRTGNVAEYSDRDKLYNDISAPGSDIFSTFPAALTGGTGSGCTPQGYTPCSTNTNYRSPEGTSFAAPQVSGAAAVLIALDPELTNNQVTFLLERTADDLNASTGCPDCAVGRDRFSGWGRLDVARAVQALLSGTPLPPPDRYEPHEDAGTQAFTLWGTARTVNAPIDYWDDPVAVYRVRLVKGQQVKAQLAGSWQGANVRLIVWRPGTTRIADPRQQKLRAAQSVGGGGTQHVIYRAAKYGWYYVEVKVESPGSGAYKLTVTKTAAPKAKP